MICAMILAAGQSRRMGVQKLLLPLGGGPVITRIVDQVLSSPVDEVFVVIGQGEKQIPASLGGRRVRFVVNPDIQAEMLSSVRCGLAAMPAECVATLVVLGDQPGISGQLIAALVDAFRTGSQGIVVPTCGGKRGHPLLFATHYRDEILTRYDEIGLRGLLRAHPEDVREVAVSTPDVLEDMDVPEDYRRTIAKCSSPLGRGIPPREPGAHGKGST